MTTLEEFARRPMNARVKQLWLGALRSGKYKQARKALRAGPSILDSTGEENNESFCCLGVLCDLAVQDGVLPVPRKDGTGTWIYGGDFWDEGEDRYDDDGSWAALPRRVQDWAGISGSDPVIWAERDTYRNNSLAEINDAGASFDLIADLIEEEL